MAQLQPLDLSWLGGGIGGMLRPGRADNRDGSAFGGKRTLFKDFLEGEGNATDEQFASDAKKARSLRTYLAELDPTLKDKVQAMGLEGLEGHAMKLAEDRLRQEANVKTQKEYLQMLADAEGLNERRQAAADRQAGQAAAGRFLKAYATQPPASLQAPGFDAQAAALAAAGPDLARGANLGALLPYLPRPENPVDRMNAEAAMLHGRANLANAEANQQRSLFGPAGTAAEAKPATVSVTTKDAQGNTVRQTMTQEEHDQQRRAALMQELQALEIGRKKLSPGKWLEEHQRIMSEIGLIDARRPPAAAPAGGGVTHRFDPATGTLVPVN